MNNFVLVLLSFVFLACNTVEPKVAEKELLNSVEIFTPIEAGLVNDQLNLSKEFKFKILFQEKYDSVVAVNGVKVPAKGQLDCIVYIPIENSSEHGYLFVSHETNKYHDVLGDGGGGTVFEIQKIDDEWSVVSGFQSVDFTEVGGTINNCGGKITPKGTVFSAEEDYFDSFLEMAPHQRDTTSINGLSRYLNYGWMVEIDPISKKALHKLYSMGRFVHEDALAMEDGKTVYLTQDDCPALFYKFIADEPLDYTKGQLYAYKQLKDGKGEWIPLPRERDSLINVTQIGLKKGATMFNRHEWLTLIGGKIYITETGKDDYNWKSFIDEGGVPANYFENYTINDSVYEDSYGRILVFDPVTNQIKVQLNGGVIDKEKETCFSNPDGLTSVQWGDSLYLVINEDLNGVDKGRMPKTAALAGKSNSDVFFLNVTDGKMTELSDLKHFLTSPIGSETTGGYFTPDGQTYFMCVQHPNKKNNKPFNVSTLVAITRR